MWKSVALALTVLTGSAGALASLNSRSPRTTPPLDERVSIVALDGAPLKLTARVVTTTSPTEIAIEATNLTNSAISDYGVRVYVFRNNGRAEGFVSKQDKPTELEPGMSHRSSASLGDIPVAADSVILIQLTTVAFHTGPRWLAPLDALERVKAQAAQLTGIAP